MKYEAWRSISSLALFVTVVASFPPAASTARAADYPEYWNCYRQMAGLDPKLDTYDQIEAAPTINVAAAVPPGAKPVLVTPVLPGRSPGTPGLYLATPTGSFRIPLAAAKMSKHDTEACPDGRIVYSFGSGNPQKKHYFKTTYAYPNGAESTPGSETAALSESQYIELVEKMNPDIRKACSVSLNDAVGGNPQSAAAWDTDAQNLVRQKIFGMMKLYNAALEVKKRRAMEDPSLQTPPLLAEHMSDPDKASSFKLQLALNSCQQVFKEGSQEKWDEFAAITRANSVRLAQVKSSPQPGADGSTTIATP